MAPSKEDRFAEFVRRLAAAPTAQSAQEARRQLADILNAIEDQMTDIPFNPEAWQSDGRMYPPRDDAEKPAGNPSWQRFRSRAHNTLFGSNGSIRIHALPSRPGAWAAGDVILDKPGADGRRIEDL